MAPQRPTTGGKKQKAPTEERKQEAKERIVIVEKTHYIVVQVKGMHLEDYQSFPCVGPKAAESVHAKPTKAEYMPNDIVNQPAFPVDRMAVPVDMRGIEEAFDFIKQLVLNAKQYYDGKEDKPKETDDESGTEGAYDNDQDDCSNNVADVQDESDEHKPQDEVSNSDEGSDADTDEFCYLGFKSMVGKKKLEALQDKLEKAEKVTKTMVSKLILPDFVDGKTAMVPIDARGIGKDFESYMCAEIGLDIDLMVNKLGPKSAAEAILKAKEYYDANAKER